MDLFFQQAINGLVVGSIYSLVALGITLIYGIMHLPNFAHGHLYMLGAYFTFFMMTLYGFSYWPAILVSVAALVLIGMLLERIVFRPLQNAPHINSMIAAVGVMLFIEATARVLWGSDYRRLDSPYGGVINLFGITITQQRLIVIIAAIVLMVGLNLFLKRTVVGSTIEAMAQSREGAFLVGINANRVSLLTFAIASGLAAAAASLAAPINLVYPSMGAMVNLKAFVIIVLGGMGSIPGAVLGGYILGMAESMSGTYVNSEYKDLVAFILLVLIMTVKPTGLFAKEVR
ncbi:branched-chain amino acid ABC transporter permease [Effusibacillus lacus]|uniref:Branched-chain amino acid ABC transporter permease n=1 Tax=Effusibacillus lacus TaxID=1348429 RepID=A0A292YIN8_9BACL|nr:branched-chain amino acid ABC transporter permease [Effusibacillus lacus]TCS75355.1 amino acid/amide ABC transporter membrane protein 1 (HAAT family) [Effusibacillus lacus]GAX89788.1 branched-chain amino acid ABC transporter permease [Effusibacillus lacus]